MDADRLSGLLLSVLSLYVIWEAAALPLGTLHAPDSGFFPLSLGGALLLLSVLTWVPTFVRRHPGESLPPLAGLPRVALTIGALIGYALVLPRLGYLAGTFLVMALLLRGLERVGWWPTLAISIGAVIVSFFAFRWLGVPLPAGILPL